MGLAFEYVFDFFKETRISSTCVNLWEEKKKQNKQLSHLFPSLLIYLERFTA